MSAARAPFLLSSKPKSTAAPAHSNRDVVAAGFLELQSTVSFLAAVLQRPESCPDYGCCRAHIRDAAALHDLLLSEPHVPMPNNVAIARTHGNVFNAQRSSRVRSSVPEGTPEHEYLTAGVPERHTRNPRKVARCVRVRF